MQLGDRIFHSHMARFTYGGPEVIWTMRDEINDLLDILENYTFQYPGPGEIVLRLKALVEKLD